MLFDETENIFQSSPGSSEVSNVVTFAKVLSVLLKVSLWHELINFILRDKKH